MEVKVGDLAAQTDEFGLFNLFLIASPMVKLVMIGLVVASILCWGIVFEKWLAVRKMKALDGQVRAVVLVGPVTGRPLPDAGSAQQ